MFLVIELLLCILIALTPLYYPLWKCLRSKTRQKWKKFWRTQRNNLIAAAILLIGSLVRLVAIERLPGGLNQDEASIGYEAYAIMNYGIDRNGNSLPVHLVAWASGQNALYAYLIMPFVAIFGNTTFAIRLPMALIGCATLIISFFALRKIFGEKKSLYFLAFLAIMPWHIMKSRWGLESNVFPDLIYWVTLLIYRGIHEKKMGPLVWSSVILGISTYAYGTSYLFVPVFFMLVYGYLLWKKRVQWKTVWVNLAVVGMIALPMILFVVINYFELNTVKLFGFITIPRLDYNRFTAITSVNGNFLSNCWVNIKETMKLIVFQTDGSVLGAINYAGIFYVFSLPFLAIGIFCAIREKTSFWKITNCAMVSALIVASFVAPNINRVNTLWLPILMYVALGFVKTFAHQKENLVIISCCYLLAFGSFMKVYFTSYRNNFWDIEASDSCNETSNGVCDAIKFAKTQPYDNLYISDQINQPYIYYLWCAQINPYDYLAQRKITEKNVMFQEVTSIGKVYFRIPSGLERGNIYILETRRLDEYDATKFQTERFGNYTVIY